MGSMFEVGKRMDNPCGLAFRRVETSPCPFEPSLSSGDRPVPVKRSLVARLTKGIVETYQKCNPGFKHSEALNPKCFLTEPSIGVLNNGHDNESSDLILYVNLVLSSGCKQRYFVEDKLGQGTFGQVAKCWDIETNGYVAVKIIKSLPHYTRHGQFEVHILSMLNKKFDPDDEHHIVRMIDSFLFQDHVCISFELLGPNLYDLLKINKHNGLSLGVISTLCGQILDALLIIGNAGIIHCDLKPENILMSIDKKTPAVKVIDFGSACFMKKTTYDYIQSRYYRSPEVLLGYPYTAAIDMWSLGCIVAELFLGLPLFPGASEYDVLMRMIEILGGQPPDYLLKCATKTDNFFKHDESIYQLGNKRNGKTDTSAYRTIREDEFEVIGLRRPKVGKKYFHSMKLEDIIMKCGNKKKFAEEQSNEDSARLLALIDFLKGLLEFDPAKRWLPWQALGHPFVTGEPFLDCYKPLPETLHTVPNVNMYYPRDSRKVLMTPTSYKSSSGSLESTRSCNYIASLGSSFWSNSDTNSASSYYSSVNCSLLNNITQVGTAGPDASTDSIHVQFHHGNKFGVLTNSSYWPMSLQGSNPFQMIPTSLKVQESTMFQGQCTPTKESAHCFSWEKGSEVDADSKYHQLYYVFSSIDPHENLFKYNHVLHDNGVSYSYDDASYPGPSSSSTLPASNHSKKGQGLSWNTSESSYSIPHPGDWEPHNIDQFVFQEDISEFKSLASGFDSALFLDYSRDLKNRTNEIDTFALNYQPVHVGSKSTCQKKMYNPDIQALIMNMNLRHSFYIIYLQLRKTSSGLLTNSIFSSSISTCNLGNHQRAQEK